MTNENKGILYYGWIKEFIVTDGRKPIEYLKDLGVEGKIVFNEKKLCYEGCICTNKVMKCLIKKHKNFWPGCFTGAYEKDGKQLPPNKQKYWEYRKF